MKDPNLVGMIGFKDEMIDWKTLTLWAWLDLKIRWLKDPNLVGMIGFKDKMYPTSVRIIVSEVKANTTAELQYVHTVVHGKTAVKLRYENEND